MKKIVIILLGLFIITGCDLLKKEEVDDGYSEVDYIDYGEVESDRIAYRNMLITTYDKYNEVIKHYKVKSKIKETDFKDNNYIVLVAEYKYCDGDIEKLKGIKLEEDILNVKFIVKKSCKECSKKFYLYLIKVKKSEINVEKDINYEYEGSNELYCDK